MKMFNKYLLKLSLLVGLNAFGSANAGFQSLHQFPVVYNINSALDANGDIYYNKTNQLFGFKDQFAPVGVTGCLIGYPEFRDKCQTVNGGFGFSFDGYTSYEEFKVYVPAGTTFFGVSGYMPQSVQYAVAVKLGSPPVKSSALTEVEYQTAKSAQNRFSDFQRLLAGEERVIVHDGGGAMSLSGIARLTTPLATGQWLYFRALNGGSIAGLGAIYEVEREKYRTAYNTLSFGTDGDPVADGGSNNGNTNEQPALTGISLSPDKWQAGAENSITVTPKPTAAALPTVCTSSNTALLSVSQNSNGQSAKFTVTAAAVTQTTSVTVTCGTKSATLNLQVADTVATFDPVDVKNQTDIADGKTKATLNITLNHTTAEVAANTKIDYWVAALVPSDLPFFGQDEWFFLSPLIGSSYQWKQLQNSLDVGSVVFEKNSNISSVNKTKKLTIPLGFAAGEFKRIGAKIYLVYSQNGGPFREVGVVWDASQYSETTP